MHDGIMDEESTQVAHAPRLVVHLRCIEGSGVMRDSPTEGGGGGDVYTS
jgi:hypothetical protein